MKPDFEKLAEAARKARETAYAPYSGFTVGAALLAKDGRVFTAGNVENASYGLGVCAERAAVFKAVSEGAREFAALAVAAGKSGQRADTAVSPCGACRQVLWEFCDEQFPVVLAGPGEELTVHTLGALLPAAFQLDKK